MVLTCLAATAQIGPAIKHEPGTKGGEGPEAKGKSAGKAETGIPGGLAGDSFPGPEIGLRLVAGQRNATADANKGALGYTSSPLIEVTQPRADTLLITMTGMAVAGGLPCEESRAEVMFELMQSFAVIRDRPSQFPVKLVLEAQLMGLFRANRDGAGVATVTVPAEACITTGGTTVSRVGFQPRTFSGKDIIMISDRSPPVEALVLPGELTLHQKFAFACAHPKKCFHKNVVMAVFGEAGRMPEWVHLLDPYRDLPRNRDLGFRVAIRVEPAPAAAAPAAAAPAALPLPRPMVPPE
jgi:hypothetical protein